MNKATGRRVTPTRHDHEERPEANPLVMSRSHQPGRIRCKLRGLYRSPVLQKAIERGLRHHPDIFEVRASTLTGSVTVDFRETPSLGPQQIEELIATIAQAAIEAAAIGQQVTVRQEASSDGQPWHTYGAADVVRILGSDQERGLGKEDSKIRFSKLGANRLTEPERPSSLKMLAKQFATVPVGLLSGSAAVSLATGGVGDAALIAGIVATNGWIGYLTESKAEEIINSLGRHAPGRVIVVRSGEAIEVGEETLVPGDLIVLNTGRVPADVRLLSARRLTVDESSLTGESMPVAKTPMKIDGAVVPLADRTNMLHAGTVVTGGSGIGIVVATGDQTEIGRVQSMLANTRSPETPLQKDLRRLGTQTVTLATLVCAGVFLTGLARGMTPAEIFKTALSLAVAAVPEGLTTVGTTTMAFGVRRMRDQNAIVRHLPAVEALGSLQYLCMDKTGTLTMNRMSVVSIFAGMKSYQCHERKIWQGDTEVQSWEVPELRRLLEVAALCNDTTWCDQAEEGEYDFKGSATESALMRLAVDGGVALETITKGYPRVKSKERTESKPFMVTYHKLPETNATFAAIKGSPSTVLKRCTQHLHDGELRPLSENSKQAILSANEQMAGRSLRVLGLAYAPDTSLEDGDGWIWLGLTGLQDPPREGVGELLKTLHRAGIKTTMMTGDQAATAEAIGRELGMNGHSKELLAMDAKAFAADDSFYLQGRAKDIHVFSRVSPTDKLKIVKTLQDLGYVVGMTGDGVNDSPALKAADIGIAMGRGGTETAIEAADVVLADDNLATLVAAIRQGRVIRANLKKSVHFQLASNLSEIFAVFASILLGQQSPFTPAQLLWINVLTDIFPALALSLDPPDPHVMEEKPPNPGEPLFSQKDMGRMVREALMMTSGVLGPYWWASRALGQRDQAQTVALLSLVGGQLAFAYNCRSLSQHIKKSEHRPKNEYMAGAVAIALAAQVVGMLTPGLRQLLGLRFPGFKGLAIAGAGAVLPYVVNEIWKALGAAPELTEAKKDLISWRQEDLAPAK